MTTKIDVSGIVREHIASLRDDDGTSISRKDLIVMFVIPGIFSAISLLTGFTLSDDSISTLISAFSIFAGFLFNVTVLIYGLQMPTEENETALLQRKLLTQTFANISFSVLSSIITIVVLLSALFSSGGIRILASAVFVGLAANFSFSLLMVLKRIHVLLGLKFES